MRITQKDIARRLGVSSSLVSRALTGTAGGIGARPDTVRRIQRKAHALGYVPSAAARRLRGKGQPVIGLVAADLEDPFFGPAVAEVIRQCHRAGFALTLTGFERREPGIPDVQILLEHGPDALLVLGSDSLEWVKPFVARRMTVVRIGTGPSWPGVTDVTVDEGMGMDLVIRHLIDLGHRNMAFVGAKLDVHQRRLRLARENLRRRKLSLPPARAVLAGPDVLEAGLLGVEKLARSCDDQWPTAIICSSDAVALGALRGVAGLGMRVPEHVSITGFDDLALARLSSPPLTSVRQPLPAMVRDALRLVQEGRAAKPPAPHPPKLIVRGSTSFAGSV
jgi:LacI family transcriptional regulator